MTVKQAKLTIQVHPNAGRSLIETFSDNVLHLKIAAPPVEGKANQELVRFLSEILDIRKSDIVIDKGTSGRRKLVIIKGKTQDDLIAAIRGAQADRVKKASIKTRNESMRINAEFDNIEY